MNKISHSTILDFGHSKLRLGVFNENLDHIYSTSKDIIEKENHEEYSKTINLIIKDAEKNISHHLENIILLYDSSKIFSVDSELANFHAIACSLPPFPTIIAFTSLFSVSKVAHTGKYH